MDVGLIGIERLDGLEGHVAGLWNGIGQRNLGGRSFGRRGGRWVLRQRVLNSGLVGLRVRMGDGGLRIAI